jgi:prophage tail gpP-like protein
MAPKKVEPGQKRWQVIEQLLREASLLGWSTGDGQEFFVGLPNYSQEPQFRFVAAAQGSRLAPLANVKRWRVVDDVADMYARLTVVGTARGNRETYGRQVTRLSAEVRDGPLPDGTGNLFAHPKHLIIGADVQSQADAEAQAQAETALRAGDAHMVELSVAGHSQAFRRRAEPALYAPDTMAEVLIEKIDLHDLYLIVGARFSESKTAGQETTLRLVRRGTKLSL